ncbi:hypothetical protein GWI33_010587 [Rhynchophorus ferrugineus]|uniref:Uncharacterized protein n=1 Tax=Rhynchophorus ferrugineus TaxID=354439 RepID=A0A834IQK2_RHYFE|nr:hypothetical protein GWI33_010587 [Rhynchophorus ferrugineus]
MKIKRYPGKAVINDPAWLEMDIPPHARGQQYEANWIDTQKNLSNSSSASNSWDKYNTKLEGSVSSRLGQYQSLLEEIRKDNNEDLYAVPKKIPKSNGSVRLKYHSDNILSRINSKSKADMDRPGIEYFLPSQSTVREPNKEHPVPRPRIKLPIQNGEQEKFKTVLEDLQRQIKKSVRFDEVSTDIDQEIERREQMEEESHVRVIVNPTHELLEKIGQGKNEDDADDGRVSQWVDIQNQYLVQDRTSEKESKELHRNDSGYYEHTKKRRQRLPPKHIYPSSSSSSSSSSTSSQEVIEPSDDHSANIEADNYRNQDDDEYNDYDEVYSLYKEGVAPAYISAPLKLPKPAERLKQTSPTSGLRRGGDSSNDFLIPRPKLIVPVHTYAVRRRRTGNLNKHDSVSSCNCLSTLERDNETRQRIGDRGM